MIQGLEFADLLILVIALLVGVAIAVLDVRERQFPVTLAGVLAVLGIVWCVRQTFIPLALVPLSLGMLLIFSYNHFVREILGSGDILLFLISGLFLPMSELGLFLLLAGLLGLVGFAVQRCRTGARELRLPFSWAILAALGVTFSLSFFG